MLLEIKLNRNMLHTLFLLYPFLIVLKFIGYGVVKTAYGDRAFMKAGPFLWNKLPSGIKQCLTCESFKRNLKT